MPQTAERSWEVAPAETLRTAPMIMLPGQTDRVLALDPSTTTDVERRRAEGGVFERPAILARRYRDVVFLGGVLYGARAARRLMSDAAAPPRRAALQAVHLSEAAYCGSWLGATYFGHWLKDDVPLALLAETYAPPFAPPPPSWHPDAFEETHVGGYMTLLDVRPQLGAAASFGRLTVFDDEDFGTHKGERLETLRDRARAALPPPRSKPPVFMRRGIADTSLRRLLNEEAVADRLAREGVTILDPSAHSAREVAEALSGAEVLIGAEGSAQCHGLLTLPRGGALISLTSPHRLCTVNKRWTDLLGVRYGMVVGHAAPDGHRVDPEEVLRTLDLALRR